MKFLFYFVYLPWFLRTILYAQTNPIETLYVAIEGDISGLLDAADEGVDRTKDKLSEVDQAGQKMGGGLKSSAGIAGLAFGLAAGGAAKLLDIVVNLAVAVPQFFAALGREAVQANAQFETFTTQFETLLGSGALAQERLGELARFGVETPFELPEVVEANIQLQTFGGIALATSENMRLLGDAAAANNANFNETAVWFGRLYSQLQGGQPFGEAAARLQELAILSPEVRAEMEAMQKQGKSGAEIWGYFSEEVGGKFGGAMAKLAKTFQGVTSNIADFRGELLREGGSEFFEEVRQSAIDFYDLLNENSDTLISISKSIGNAAASVVRFIREGLGKIDFVPFLEGLKSFVDEVVSVGKQFALLVTIGGKFLASFKPIFSFVKMLVGEGFGPASQILGFLWEQLKRVDDALIAGAKVLALSAAGWKGLLATLAPIGNVITKIGQATLALAQGQFRKAGKLAGEALDQVKDGLFDVDAGVKAVEESILESSQIINNWNNPVEEMNEEIEATKPAEIPEPEVPDLTGVAEKYSNQLFDAIENRDEQLEQLEADHAEKITKIMADANKKRLDIDDKFGKDQAKLAADSEKKRLEVIDDTRKKLADLATETDRDLKARRKDFNDDERRETEDHLKEMRRLQEDHLLSLEDAVKNRDAGAIVDLQRKFEIESSRREEDFQEGRSQQREDFDAELEAVRENEAQKRDEILAAQAETLEDIRANEEERRMELEARRQEELEKLNQNLQEKIQQENENYSERQAALEEALQKKLASIAQSLSDEKDVTEEGAKQILETYNEFFGIGGDIDKLMDDFVERRKKKSELASKFSGEDSSSETKATSSGGSAFGGFGDRLGGVSEFAAGGTLIATKPTLAMFGEAGPEVVQFTPMSQLSSPNSQEPGRMVIEMTGSAPPGIGTGERDQIAAVLLTALQETGALSS